jgi:hypothetical protein
VIRRIIDCLWLSILSIALAFSILGAICCFISLANAQVHQHPNETIIGPTAQFYETWKRPDMPDVSCCNKADCYATPARMEGGKVLALHRESGDWIEIPAAKVELNRISPDGLSHLCASSYKYVYCFVWGGGT